jgi:hypothetical protein
MAIAMTATDRVPACLPFGSYAARACPPSLARLSGLTIGSMARAMLINADLKDYFWPFATQAAVHIKNRVPHSSLPPDKTPFKLWHRYKPNLSHLRLFCVTCTSRVLSNNLTKFTPRGETGRFLSYAKDAKGYLVWIPGPRNCGGTVKTRRDVVFHNYPVLSEDMPPMDTESNMWDDVTYSDHTLYPQRRSNQLKSKRYPQQSSS